MKNNLLIKSAQNQITIYFLFALIFYSVAIPKNCFGQTIEKEIAFEGFNLKLSEINNQIEVDLDGKQGPLKTHSEIVPNPNRFLIDVLGIPSNTARSIELKGELVEKIRVGIHRDKTRIVIDLRKDLENLHDSKVDNSDPNLSVYKYLFKLKGDKTNNGIQSATESAQTLDTTPVKEAAITVQPTIFPVPSASPEPTVTLKVDTVEPVPTIAPKDMARTISNIEKKADLSPNQKASDIEIASDLSTPEVIVKNKTIESVPLDQTKEELTEIHKDLAKVEKLPPKIEPSPIREIDQAIIDIKKSNLGKINILKNVVFQTTSDNVQSTIAISLSNLGAYELKQESENKYIVEFPNTRLRAEHLKLPQYPPDSFKGFVYIKAEETENSSSVIIVVEPSVKLSAEVSQGKLWIKSK